MPNARTGPLGQKSLSTNKILKKVDFLRARAIFVKIDFSNLLKILVHFRLYEAILGHLAQFGAILDHLGLF